MKKNKKIVICTPYLDNIGGTEIEALLTAVQLYDMEVFNSVAVFSPVKSKNIFWDDILLNRDIKLLHYPKFFSSKWVQLFNRVLGRSGVKINLFEYLYWLVISLRFNCFFVLLYPKCVYFFPLLFFNFKKNKRIAKVTMWHFEPLPLSHYNFYNKFDKIIVFNKAQALFWREKNALKNTIPADIMIMNESALLQLPNKRFQDQNLVFGYLGRISREKNIEDMIYLIDYLNNIKKVKCKMVIQGEGDDGYLEEIKNLIDGLNLIDDIEINCSFISPPNTCFFYKKIDVFLVTSKNEGGPMTALEAVAAGCFTMGYDIGAMRERFERFPYIVNRDIEELKYSAWDFFNLPAQAKSKIVNELRSFYISNLCNDIKRNNLYKMFEQ